MTSLALTMLALWAIGAIGIVVVFGWTACHVASDAEVRAERMRRQATEFEAWEQELTNER